MIARREGALFALRTMAAMVAQYRNHPDIIAWQLQKLSNLGSRAGRLAEAQALYDAFEAQCSLVRDPMAETFISPHLLLGNGTAPPIIAEADMSDLVCALLSAYEAAGFRTAIVGCQTQAEGPITTVIGDIYIANMAAWIHVCPGHKMPLGQKPQPVIESLRVDVPR